MAGGGDVIAAGLRLAVLRTFDRPSAGRPNSTYVGAEAGLSVFHLDVTAGFFLASKAGPGSDVVGALSIGLGNAP